MEKMDWFDLVQDRNRWLVLISTVMKDLYDPGESCSTNGGEVYTGFWWGNLGERDQLEDTGIDRRIIIRWIFRKWGHGLDQSGAG